VGDKVKIEFAVNHETDVAVYIEDADGRIVRHLVAGVLGETPPPPLKPNSLSQRIEWDGIGDDKVWCYRYRKATVMRPEEKELGRKSRPFRAAATCIRV